MTGYLRLGVNIDHVAAIRHAGGGGRPDPVRAVRHAAAADEFGLDSAIRGVRALMDRAGAVGSGARSA